MLKREQKKYLDELWAGVNNNLRDFLTDGDPKQLHHLRVNIKKLKALFMLAGSNSLKRHFKSVRKIFKHAGQIRDAYNNLEITSRYHIEDDNFKTAQHLEISKQTDAFKITGPRYLKKVRKAKKTIYKKLHPVDNKHFYKFFSEGLSEIAEQLATRHTDEDLHNNRRLIKTLVYNHKIAPKKADKKLHLDHDYMDKLQAVIGDWHDTVVAIDKLSATAPKQVISRIKSRNTRLRRSVKQLSADFLNKATAAAKIPDEPVNQEKR